MKALKALGAGIFLVVLVILFARFLLSQLGAPRASGPAAVIDTVPSGFAVEDLGAATEAQAARALAARVAAVGRAGVRFTTADASVVWLADPATDEIEERRAGAAGTRLRTLWHGGVAARLTWASAHGTLEAPGLAPGERSNQYH